MSDPAQVEWTIESENLILRLVLFRAGDRYAHRIEARNRSGELLERIESVEGAQLASGGCKSPESAARVFDTNSGDLHPPLADESSDEASRTLAAISDTWPASPAFQQFHEQEIDGRRTWMLVGMAGKSHWSASIVALPDTLGWEFDVACRYKQSPPYLGSAYRIAKGDDLPQGANYCRVLSNTDSHSVVADDLVFATPCNELPPPPASARWRYRFEFADC